MRKRLTLFGSLCLLFAFILPAYAENKRSENGKNLQTEPLFKDGKGYYSYKQPIKVEVPKGKVKIHYFYRYGCEVCLNADDYLKLYAARHSDKVELIRVPAFEKGDPFTAQMNATFAAYGGPELSDKFLFDSAGRKGEQSLVENNNAIKRWLAQNSVDIDAFYQLFLSEKVKQQVEQDRSQFRQFSPPITPMAVLNGKYLLIHNTLYNDDYTYAVLDFLVEKLLQEQQVTGEK